MEETNSWIFHDDFFIRGTPSRLSKMPVQLELKQRELIYSFIIKLGSKLKLDAPTILLAQVYVHRYYARIPITASKYYLASAAIAISCKLNDNYRQPSKIALAASILKNPSPSIIIDEHSDIFWRWRDQLLFREELLLKTLNFDLFIDLPYNIEIDSVSDDIIKNAISLIEVLSSLPILLSYDMKTLLSTALIISSNEKGTTLPHGVIDSVIGESGLVDNDRSSRSLALVNDATEDPSRNSQKSLQRDDKDLQKSSSQESSTQRSTSPGASSLSKFKGSSTGIIPNISSIQSCWNCYLYILRLLKYSKSDKNLISNELAIKRVPNLEKRVFFSIAGEEIVNGVNKNLEDEKNHGENSEGCNKTMETFDVKADKIADNTKSEQITADSNDNNSDESRKMTDAFEVKADKITDNIKANNVIVDSKADNVTADSKADNVIVDSKADNVTADSKADNVIVDSKADNVIVDSKADSIEDKPRGADSPDKSTKADTASEVVNDNKSSSNEKVTDDAENEAKGNKPTESIDLKLNTVTGDENSKKRSYSELEKDDTI